MGKTDVRQAPDEFKNRGMLLVKLMENDNALLYSIRNADDPSRHIIFEVWRKIIVKESVLHGKVIPKRVKLMSHNNFGTWAWTTGNINKIAQYYYNLSNGKSAYGCELNELDKHDSVMFFKNQSSSIIPELSAIISKINQKLNG